MSHINNNNYNNTPWNPFTILNLPQQYEISPAEIKQATLKLLAVNHPDRVTDPADRDKAELVSAQINKASRILLDDESRANQLLTLSGGPDKDQDKSLPEGFLIEIMEIRQDMETALTSDNPEEKQKYQSWAKQKSSQYKSKIQQLFKNLSEIKTTNTATATNTAKPADTDTLTQEPAQTHEQTNEQAHEILTAIRLELNAWRYIQRMIEQLNN